MTLKQKLTAGKVTNWPAFILDSNTDPSTQQVSSPFAGTPSAPSVDPYMTDPTEVDPTGATVYLRQKDWPTLATAQAIADILGGIVIALPSPMQGVTFNQPLYGVQITGPGTNNTTADCPYLLNGQTTASVIANLFPGNKAIIQQALPQILGIVAGG